ncbi:MAG TPA: hypothetical protein VM367_05610 [Pseudonocardia sp.]|jgi:hypothetical protein|nr:hypothetical protein [Pseudonocardia sp.]
MNDTATTTPVTDTTAGERADLLETLGKHRFFLREDVPSSVELRWRPGDHQAAAAVSV